MGTGKVSTCDQCCEAAPNPVNLCSGTEELPTTADVLIVQSTSVHEGPHDVF